METGQGAKQTLHLPEIPETIHQEQGGAAPAPVRFDPNTLYPLEAIERALQGVMGLETFMEGLRLNGTGKGRMFRAAIWGWEVLEAIKRHQAAPAAEAVSLPASTRRARNVKPAPRANVKQVLDCRNADR